MRKIKNVKFEQFSFQKERPKFKENKNKEKTEFVLENMLTNQREWQKC